MLFLPDRLSVSAWCLPPVRREAVVLFCWTHGKGTAGTWAMRVCPLHAANKDGQCSQHLFFKLIYREQRSKLHLMRIISFAQEESRDYLQGNLRMLVSPQPCSSWSFERPSSACSPRFPLLCFPLFAVCWHFAFPSRTMFAYFLFLLICKCFCL